MLEDTAVIARDKVWWASQMKMSVTLDSAETKALWDSILADTVRMLKAENTLKEVQATLNKHYVSK